MSFIDDHYGDILTNRYNVDKSVKNYEKTQPNQQVVQATIQSLKSRPADESKVLDRMAKEILVTVSRTKRLSGKQKTCLVRFLVERDVRGFEVQDWFSRNQCFV